MEKVLKRAILVIVVMALMLPLMAPRVFAAAGITISGGDNVKGGEKFTVAVTYGGGSVGRVDGQMAYDTSKLTYLSGGTSSGNTGYIQLAKAGTGDAITFNIEFQAVAEGTTGLEVTTNNLYDLNESAMELPAAATKTVTITGDAEEDQLITETTSPDQPVDATKQKGMDEKPEPAVSANVVLLISVAVVAVLIAIIAAILISKRKKEGGPKGPKPPESPRPSEPSDPADSSKPFETPTAPTSSQSGDPSYENPSYGSYDDSQQAWDPPQEAEAPDDLREPFGEATLKQGTIAGRSKAYRAKQAKKERPDKPDREERAHRKRRSKDETVSWDEWSGWDEMDRKK